MNVQGFGNVCGRYVTLNVAVSGSEKLGKGLRNTGRRPEM
jgi:hypothetical protein